MLIIDGVCIKDASGGGDVLIVTTRGKETWLDPDTAANLLGRGYFDNKELRKLMDDDFNAAMSECVGEV